MMRDSSNRYFFKLETWKVLWTLLSSSEAPVLYCQLGQPFKDLKWSNVPGVKLSLFSKSYDTFPSLQALSDLHYLFGGFMDYLWSREFGIFTLGPTRQENSTSGKCLSHLFSKSITHAQSMSVWMVLSLCPSVWG
ncbi:hypothetical protein Tco_1294091 [Tanacetum coccineum]